jgi:hypothetical protein
MNNVMKVIVLLVFVACIAGCFNSDITIRVAPDGSGFIEENMLLSQETITMLKNLTHGLESALGPQQSADLSFSRFFNEEEFKKRALTMGEGISFLSGKTIDSPDGQGYQAVYRFIDISKLKYNNQQDSNIAIKSSDTRTSLPGNLLQFSFQRGDPAVLTIKMPQGSIPGFPEEKPVPGNDRDNDKDKDRDKKDPRDMGHLSDFTRPGDSQHGVLMGSCASRGGGFDSAQALCQEDREKGEKPEQPEEPLPPGKGDNSTPGATDAESQKAAEALKYLMKGMRFRLALECGESIMDTNATFTEGNRVLLMEIDMNKLLEDEKALSTLTSKGNMADMKSLTKDIPGVKFETQPEVWIKFR